jgi:hypothetical protein
MKARFKKQLLGSLMVGSILTSCQPSEQMSQKTNQTKVEVVPTVVTEGRQRDQRISDQSGTIRVMGSETLLADLKNGDLRQPIAGSLASTVDAQPAAPGVESGPVKDESLYIQLPRDVLNHGHLFGGVITSVSQGESEKLGRLKLADLSPIHVRPLVAKQEGSADSFFVVLVGCVSQCAEASAQQQLIGLPIQGMTPDGSQIVIDVSKFGETLNLVDVLDPNGEYSGLTTLATRTVAVDKSGGTLVWDVEHTMVPKNSVDVAVGDKILIIARYYLKLESALNSAFVSRKQVPGVGFFTTSRANEELITRFSQTEFSGKPIHYFIKNVPARYQASFAASFEDWNLAFQETIGRTLISYEFVPEGDPKNEILTAGDVRYNILEWDVKNRAPYGGLGPSIASQTTGEIFSANVLVQGPSIEKIYKEWFGVSEKAQQLSAAGQNAQAERLLVEARRSILKQLDQSRGVSKLKISLGSALEFRHHAENEQLQDRIAARQDFFDLPVGETYDTYMYGYFKDLVSHELGHNLGLRHNFKGNLFASEDGSHPSQSIMEYLNREYRHKDKIGSYDKMAIQYGYGGVAPAKTDMFCTDEDVVSAENPRFSAECSRDDATHDSFAYFGKILNRVLERAVALNSDQAPTWSVADLESQLNLSTSGILAYATSAEATGQSWLNFSRQGRPSQIDQVPNYVLNSLRGQVCSPEILGAAQQKATEEAKALTAKSLQDLQLKLSDLSQKFGLAGQIFCSL